MIIKQFEHVIFKSFVALMLVQGKCQWWGIKSWKGSTHRDNVSSFHPIGRMPGKFLTMETGPPPPPFKVQFICKCF